MPEWAEGYLPSFLPAGLFGRNLGIIRMYDPKVERSTSAYQVNYFQNESKEISQNGLHDISSVNMTSTQG